MALELSNELLAGISQTNLSVDSIVDAFTSADLSVNRRTVQKIQCGQRPGTKLDLFYAYKHQIDNNNATKKNKFYHDLADTIIEFESRQSEHPYRLKSIGLTKLVAEDLELTREEVNALIMGARADILTNLNPITLRSFHEWMTRFLNANSVRTPTKEWRKIRNDWDHTPRHFYELVNDYFSFHGSNRVSGSAFGSLVPYEAYFMRDHYDYLINQATQEPSPLDRRIGEHITVTESPKIITLDNEGVETMLAELPLRYDRDALFVNMRVFAFGDAKRKTRVA